MSSGSGRSPRRRGRCPAPRSFRRGAPPPRPGAACPRCRRRSRRRGRSGPRSPASDQVLARCLRLAEHAGGAQLPRQLGLVRVAGGQPHLAGAQGDGGRAVSSPTVPAPSTSTRWPGSQPAQSQAVDGHRHRLRQRGDARVEIVGNVEQPAGRQHDVLGEAPVPVDAEDLELRADGVASGAAVVAASAGGQRLRRPPASPAVRPSTPSPTASTRPAISWPGVVPGTIAAELEEVEVGAAEAAGLDPQPHLAGPRFGHRSAGERRWIRGPSGRRPSSEGVTGRSVAPRRGSPAAPGAPPGRLRREPLDHGAHHQRPGDRGVAKTSAKRPPSLAGRTCPRRPPR